MVEAGPIWRLLSSQIELLPERPWEKPRQCSCSFRGDVHHGYHNSLWHSD